MTDEIIEDHLQNSQFILIDNIFHSKKHNVSVALSKNQNKLLHCLLTGQGKKQQVIDFIWGRGDPIKNKSKYTQLILRTRKKLRRAGFPDDTILTISRFGVFLNKSPSPPVGRLYRDVIDMDIESRIIHSFHM